MKFILERSDALTAINRVTGVVARNSNVPILNNVLIETQGGGIRLRATDLDMEATTTCPAAVETQGATTVVFIDVNGDTTIDMRLLLTGNLALTADHFLL